MKTIEALLVRYKEDYFRLRKAYCDHQERLYLFLSIVAFTYVSIHKWVRIAFGDYDIGRGDDASRLLLIQKYFLSLKQFFSIGFWTSWDPIGPLYLNAAILKLMTIVGIDPNPVVVTLSVSTLFLAIGIWLLSRIATQVLHAELAGFLSVVALSGSAMAYEVGVSAFGETYAFGFIAMALWCLRSTFISRQFDFRQVAFAAFLFFLATICRREAIIAPMALSMIWFFERRWKYACLLLLGSSFYFWSKIFAITMWGVGGINEFNLQNAFLWNSLDTATLWQKFSFRIKGAIFSSYYWPIEALGFALFLTSWRKDLSKFLLAFIVLFTGLICYAVLTGKINYGVRYLYMTFVFVSLAAAMGTYLLQQRLPYLWSKWVLILLFFFSYAFTLKRVDNAVKYKVPPPVKQARNWLRTHLQKEEKINFDFLNNWDQYLHVYVDYLGQETVGYSYSFFPKSLRLNFLKRVEPPALFSKMNSHRHFYLDRPEYVVLANGELFRRIERQERMAKHLATSYIRPHLREIEAGKYHFKPIYPDNEGHIILQEIYTNPYLKIFKTDYSEITWGTL